MDVWIVNDLSSLLGESTTYAYATEKKARRHFEELKGGLMCLLVDNYPEEEDEDSINEDINIAKDEIWVSGYLLDGSDCHVSIGWLEVK